MTVTVAVTVAVKERPAKKEGVAQVSAPVHFILFDAGQNPVEFAGVDFDTTVLAQSSHGDIHGRAAVGA